jgi:hypothetical protein
MSGSEIAWLTDVLKRIASGQTKRNQLDTLLPWNWKQQDDAEPVNSGTKHNMRAVRPPLPGSARRGQNCTLCAWQLAGRPSLLSL